MHGRRMATLAIAATVMAGAVGVQAGAAKSTSKSRRVTCDITLVTNAAPTDVTGTDFGDITCNRFGTGVQKDTFTLTPASPSEGSATGPFKQYFDRGTVHGTYAFTYKATSPTDISYTGTFKYTGGTGAFHGVRGSGTLTCSSKDSGETTTCHAAGRLSPK